MKIHNLKKKTFSNIIIVVSCPNDKEFVRASLATEDNRVYFFRTASWVTNATDNLKIFNTYCFPHLNM